MDSDTISTLTARIDSFPTLPTVVAQVIEITANPESSARDLMGVIGPDQSLTATILKIANSAFFGLARGVSSLQQALTVLGFTEIRNVVLAKAVFSSFKNLRKDRQFDIGKFWEHSFLCGLAARTIATDLRGDSNELFVAGLIHDIGKLIVWMALPMEFYKIIDTAGSSKLMTFRAEKSILGVTHDELGMKLLTRWMFPENLVTAVGFHHRPQEAKRHSLFSLVVHISDLVAHLSEVPDGGEDDTFLKEALSHPEIIKMSRSHGLEWNSSAVEKLREKLARRKEEEAGALSLFLS